VWVKLSRNKEAVLSPPPHRVKKYVTLAVTKINNKNEKRTKIEAWTLLARRFW
jgi:hypothetical protein